jgi:hypothetical protein
MPYGCLNFLRLVLGKRIKMYDDCEISEFYSESWHVARKEHKCCECGTTIKIKEKYLSCTGKWDGRVSTFKQHSDCLEACVGVRNFQDGFCVPFGELFEWYGCVRKKDLPKDLRSKIAKALNRHRHRGRIQA